MHPRAGGVPEEDVARYASGLAPLASSLGGREARAGLAAAFAALACLQPDLALTAELLAGLNAMSATEVGCPQGSGACAPGKIAANTRHLWLQHAWECKQRQTAIRRTPCDEGAVCISSHHVFPGLGIYCSVARWGASPSSASRTANPDPAPAQVDALDYDVRMRAYARLLPEAWAAMAPVQALPLLHACLADLRNADDLALRHAASQVPRGFL